MPNKSRTNSGGIPFYSQIWDLNKWSELGFNSYQDAKYWQDSSCGVLCLKMAVDGILAEESDPIAEMIKKGQEIGAYSHTQGWSHQGLAELARWYQVKAHPDQALTAVKIKKILEEGGLVIASVKWAFESTKSWRERVLFWRKRGGHLALIIGYHREGFAVNHTSITPGYNWQGELVPFKKFSQGFTGRGVVITTRV